MAESVRPRGIYQTLDEQREKLSPAEERFERARQTVGLFLGPLVFLALYLAATARAPRAAGFGGGFRLRHRLLAHETYSHPWNGGVGFSYVRALRSSLGDRRGPHSTRRHGDDPTRRARAS